ncbi:UNKNOWN [Stylonychia lemnae]|uniref:Uncharacterized protein n=1 Tax=Stylonychia lemnae TaxID=5949 RepID=A0A078ARW2_STYLE|nr:UNKNOWN [Stylonychia lemnae]|eukprot:CDW84914.1 UNKNOWN [Stylonychia lemnae]
MLGKLHPKHARVSSQNQNRVKNVLRQEIKDTQQNDKILLTDNDQISSHKMEITEQFKFSNANKNKLNLPSNQDLPFSNNNQFSQKDQESQEFTENTNKNLLDKDACSKDDNNHLFNYGNHDMDSQNLLSHKDKDKIQRDLSSILHKDQNINTTVSLRDQLSTKQSKRDTMIETIYQHTTTHYTNRNAFAQQTSSFTSKRPTSGQNKNKSFKTIKSPKNKQKQPKRIEDENKLEDIEQKIRLLDSLIESDKISKHIKQTQSDQLKIMKQKVQKLREAEQKLNEIRIGQSVQNFQNQSLISEREQHQAYAQSPKDLQCYTLCEESMKSEANKKRRLIYMQHKDQNKLLNKAEIMFNQGLRESGSLHSSSLDNNNSIRNTTAYNNVTPSLQNFKLLSQAKRTQNQSSVLRNSLQTDSNRQDYYSIYENIINEKQATEIIQKIIKQRPKSEYHSKKAARRTENGSLNIYQNSIITNEKINNTLNTRFAVNSKNSKYSSNKIRSGQSSFNQMVSQLSDIRIEPMIDGKSVVINFKQDSRNKEQQQTRPATANQQSRIIIKFNNIGRREQHNFAVQGINNFEQVSIDYKANLQRNTQNQSFHHQKQKSSEECSILFDKTNHLRKASSTFQHQSSLRKSVHSKTRNQAQNKADGTSSFHNSELLSFNSSFHADKIIDPAGINQTRPAITEFVDIKMNKKPEQKVTRKQFSSADKNKKRSIRLLQNLNQHAKNEYYDPEDIKSTRKLTSDSLRTSQNPIRNMGNTNSIYLSNSIAGDDNDASNLVNKKFSAYNIGYSQPSHFLSITNRDSSKKKLNSVQMSSKDINRLNSQNPYLTAQNSVHEESLQSDVDVVNILSQRGYTKIRRDYYSKDQGKNFSNDAYINSLEIKNRVAESNYRHSQSRDKNRL